MHISFMIIGRILPYKHRFIQEISNNTRYNKYQYFKGKKMKANLPVAKSGEMGKAGPI